MGSTPELQTTIQNFPIGGDQLAQFRITLPDAGRKNSVHINIFANRVPPGASGARSLAVRRVSNTQSIPGIATFTHFFMEDNSDVGGFVFTFAPHDAPNDQEITFEFSWHPAGSTYDAVYFSISYWVSWPS